MIEQTHRRIQVLDAHIANKIAAGEVVERPAAVVKELVENALDAHARRIDVFAESGGTRLIRVVDDGWGVGRDDLDIIFRPHATSKLADVEDLECIATLGFRGEALASIGAVSQAHIVSRLHGADAGFAVENNGGKITAPRAAGAAPGTEVCVRNLFFNTPARARFLRTVRTEFGHIEDLVVRFALAFPEVGFRLAHDGAEVLRCAPDQSREERVRQLFGAELAGQLLALHATGLEGFVSPPGVTRANARGMHFFVNGRYVRDKILHRVVRDGYRDTLHHGRYPVVFLFFEIDPREIDVNVHPTKSEVRWRNPRMLHSMVTPALGRVLRASDCATTLSPTEEGIEPGHRQGVRDAMEDFFRSAGADRVSNGSPPAYGSRPAAAPASVFQVHDSYLICEVDDGIAIVDQHALHERVQYDRLLRRLNDDGVETQKLLVPEPMELLAADRALLEEHEELMARCGFAWSPFGGNEIALESIPVVIPRKQAPDLMRDLVELLRARGTSVEAKTLFHEVADTMACKAAVRFGDRLSREEAAALVEESGALERAFVCPHGRPTVLRLTFAELEKRFGRR